MKKLFLYYINFERSVVNKSTNSIKKYDINVNTPLLILINIPVLLIDSVEIDFSMEVKDIISNKNFTITKDKNMFKKFNKKSNFIMKDIL